MSLAGCQISSLMLHSSWTLLSGFSSWPTLFLHSICSTTSSSHCRPMRQRTVLYHYALLASQFWLIKNKYEWSYQSSDCAQFIWNPDQPWLIILQSTVKSSLLQEHIHLLVSALLVAAKYCGRILVYITRQWYIFSVYNFKISFVQLCYKTCTNIS